MFFKIKRVHGRTSIAPAVRDFPHSTHSEPGATRIEASARTLLVAVAAASSVPPAGTAPASPSSVRIPTMHCRTIFLAAAALTAVNTEISAPRPHAGVHVHQHHLVAAPHLAAPSPFGHGLRSEFMFDPNTTNFNHGSYGGAAGRGRRCHRSSLIGLCMGGHLLMRISRDHEARRRRSSRSRSSTSATSRASSSCVRWHPLSLPC